MAYKYKITPLAVSDIDDALDYISHTLQNQSASLNLFNSIKKEISHICENPYVVPDCYNYMVNDNTIRHAIIGNYVLVFMISEEDMMVKILRFLYGSRDIPNISLV